MAATGQAAISGIDDHVDIKLGDIAYVSDEFSNLPSMTNSQFTARSRTRPAIIGLHQ